MTSSLLPYLSLLATVAAGTTPAAAAAVAGRSVFVVLHDASSVPVLCVVCEGVCLRKSSIEVDERQLPGSRQPPPHTKWP